MEEAEFRITVHMIISLDGFIAKKDNSIAWFESTCNYENGIDAPNSVEFLKSIDCYLMGSNTYEFATTLSKEHGWPYGNTPTIVLTSKNLKSNLKNIEFFSGDLHKMVETKLKPSYKKIWVVGGAKVASEFINKNLADEIHISILPIILGEGISIFNGLLKEQKLNLINACTYKNGLVELRYHLL
jgi:dihydrofolate reductase